MHAKIGIEIDLDSVLDKTDEKDRKKEFNM